MALLAGTVGGSLRMCPKSFHLAWIAIVEIGSVCTFVECLVGDVIRIKDPKKEVQLFAVESVEAIKVTFCEAPCADVVSQVMNYWI